MVLGCTQQGTGNNTEINNKSGLPVWTNNSNSTLQPSIVASSLVEKGDVVFLDYVAATFEGQVYDTSMQDVAQKYGLPAKNYTPISIMVGNKQVDPWIEEGVVGMKVGEAKRVTIVPEKAFGAYARDKIIVFPNARISNGGSEGPAVGSIIRLNNSESGVVIAKVENNSIIDLNHPLAGKTLTFDLIIRSTTKAKN